MDVGEKYFDFAAGAKEVGDMDLLPTVTMRLVDLMMCSNV